MYRKLTPLKEIVLEHKIETLDKKLSKFIEIVCEAEVRRWK